MLPFPQQFKSTNTSHYKLLIIFLSFQDSCEKHTISDFVCTYMTKILCVQKDKMLFLFKTLRSTDAAGRCSRSLGLCMSPNLRPINFRNRLDIL